MIRYTLWAHGEIVGSVSSLTEHIFLKAATKYGVALMITSVVLL